VWPKPEKGSNYALAEDVNAEDAKALAGRSLGRTDPDDQRLVCEPRGAVHPSTLATRFCTFIVRAVRARAMA